MMIMHFNDVTELQGIKLKILTILVNPKSNFKLITYLKKRREVYKYFTFLEYR